MCISFQSILSLDVIISTCFRSTTPASSTILFLDNHHARNLYVLVYIVVKLDYISYIRSRLACRKSLIMLKSKRTHDTIANCENDHESNNRRRYSTCNENVHCQVVFADFITHGNRCHIGESQSRQAHCC